MVDADGAKSGVDGCRSGGGHRVMLKERAKYANVKKPQ